jgi:hypothetical protein
VRLVVAAGIMFLQVALEQRASMVVLQVLPLAAVVVVRVEPELMASPMVVQEDLV